MSRIVVVKRDNSEEELNFDKIHKVLTWAAKGLEGVSVSDVELKSKIQEASLPASSLPTRH